MEEVGWRTGDKSSLGPSTGHPALRFDTTLPYTRRSQASLSFAYLKASVVAVSCSQSTCFLVHNNHGREQSHSLMFAKISYGLAVDARLMIQQQQRQQCIGLDLRKRV